MTIALHSDLSSNTLARGRARLYARIAATVTHRPSTRLDQRPLYAPIDMDAVIAQIAAQPEGVRRARAADLARAVNDEQDRRNAMARGDWMGAAVLERRASFAVVRR